MAPLSILSWNVEHFRGDANRISRVVDLVKGQAPDVFALYEVEGKTVFDELFARLPGYQFHITEGTQVQEILVGVRPGLTAFFTQRLEFKAQNPSLRPGAFLTVRQDGVDTCLLFLHVKSGTSPLGLGLRDDMFERAFRLKKTLDAKAGGAGKARYLFMGDLNVMGMDYPFDLAIDPAKEIQKLDQLAKKNGMRRLTKSAKYTWWNGPGSRDPKSDLDHVVATTNLKFTQTGIADVQVLGWPQLDDQAAGEWIKENSDHGVLKIEVDG